MRCGEWEGKWEGGGEDECSRYRYADGFRYVAFSSSEEWGTMERCDKVLGQRGLITCAEFRCRGFCERGDLGEVSGS